MSLQGVYLFKYEKTRGVQKNEKSEDSGNQSLTQSRSRLVQGWAETALSLKLSVAHGREDYLFINLKWPPVQSPHYLNRCAVRDYF
jgi:hypothetical protein